MGNSLLPLGLGDAEETEDCAGLGRHHQIAQDEEEGSVEDERLPEDRVFQHQQHEVQEPSRLNPPKGGR